MKKLKKSKNRKLKQNQHQNPQIKLKKMIRRTKEQEKKGTFPIVGCIFVCLGELMICEDVARFTQVKA